MGGISSGGEKRSELKLICLSCKAKGLVLVRRGLLIVFKSMFLFSTVTSEAT